MVIIYDVTWWLECKILGAPSIGEQLIGEAALLRSDRHHIGRTVASDGAGPRHAPNVVANML